MAVDHRLYLAENLLNEHRIISYRTLSRALKVHVNQAKRMLYDFYERENAKKKGSVHAMYLLAGTKKAGEAAIAKSNGHVNGDGDVNPSSPIMSSSMPQPEEEEVPILVKTITLVREEDLEDVKASYDHITSIHIYSLEPARIQDLQTLTDTGREIFASTFVKEDPLEHYKNYGIIQNKHVKRRTGVKPPLPSAVIATQPTKSAPSTTTPSAAPPTSKTNPTSTASSNPFPKAATVKRSDSQDSAKSAAANSGATKPTTLKRDTSSIFQSFAKAKTKADAKAETASNEDSVMKDASEGEADEEEEEAMFLDTGKRTSSSNSKAREEREERSKRLKSMMDESDEEDENKDMIDLDTKEGEVSTTITTKKKTPAKEDSKEEETWPSSPEPPTTSPPEPHTTNPTDTPAQEPTNRRRSRRKVMKKRTMKDEEGYLVTKEEAVWESFSEDEDLSATSKTKALPSVLQKPKTTAAAAKGGAGAQMKGGGKGGNIMSFFAKK